MNQRAMQWIVGGDVGASSRTVWSVMMGVTPNDADVPHDPDDFGRCYRLLELIPAWRGELEKMNALPAWRPFVREWSRLEAMYEAAPLNRYGVRYSREMYDAMQPLVDESREADGWTVTGRTPSGKPVSWERKEKHRLRVGNVEIES